MPNTALNLLATTVDVEGHSVTISTVRWGTSYCTTSAATAQLLLCFQIPG